jgi:PEP-CTERM motif
MKRFVLASLFALTCAVPSAQAATIQLDINVLLEGALVSGDSTVATLLFEDVAPNQVRLTVTSSLNAANEFISDISFNVATNFNPATIGASYVAGSQVGSFDLPTLTSSANGQNPAGPGSGFDYLYSFTVSNGGGGGARFNLNDSFQYLFTANGLDALDFAFLNAQGYSAYAHVQGMTAGSGSYAATNDPNVPTVPEPTSLVLLATGLIAGARTLRKRS